MDRLPLFVDLRGRAVVLIGDGPAADAKRRLIEGAGGRIVDEATPEARLAFVALDGDAAASEAARLKAAGLLVNVVDRPDLCDFLVPAIVDRSPVIIAIGTGGASATLAKSLRERFEAMLPATLGALARAIGVRRREVAARLPTPDARRRFWDSLIAPGAALDPLQPADDPATVIDGALASPPVATPRLTVITLTSDDPDDLTLRQLRVLSRADTIFSTPGVPAAVLDRARRDAVRVACLTAPDELPVGESVFLAPA